MNGTEGIAVGMATKIPPHNLTEVLNSLIRMVEKGNSWDFTEVKKLDLDYKNLIKEIADIEKLPKNRFHKFSSDTSTEEIIEDIKGPDFPTKAEIYNQKSIKDVYNSGRGAIVMRGVSSIEQSKSGRNRIIITELPYQVNKAVLLAKIAQLHKDKKIQGISDIRDESNREGIRIIIEIKKRRQT